MKTFGNNNTLNNLRKIQQKNQQIKLFKKKRMKINRNSTNKATFHLSKCTNCQKSNNKKKIFYFNNYKKLKNLNQEIKIKNSRIKIKNQKMKIQNF